MPNAERQPITDWKDWRDVFASETIIPGDKLNKFSARELPERTCHTWYIKERVSAAPMYLSRFCRLKRLDRIFYLDVQPTKAAIEAMERYITFVEFDTMNFEAIEWQDGRTLIVCHNSKIIGGPWVAKINSTTIPHFVEE